MYNTNSLLDVHLSSLGAWAVNWHIPGGQTLSWQKKQKVLTQWHWTGAEKGEQGQGNTPMTYVAHKIQRTAAELGF